MLTNKIKHAIAFAMKHHSHQFRRYTGEPYFNHLNRVADSVEKLGGTEDMIVAAWLHDVVEDTEVTFDIIHQKFGYEVMSLVVELTSLYTSEKYPEKNRAKRKELEAVRLGTISKEAKLIKRCDISDNLTSIVIYDPEFAKLYLAEKAEVLKRMGY